MIRKNAQEHIYEKEHIMKVAFENGVSTYSGRYLEVVYQSWYSDRLCYARKNFYPTLGEQHQHMAAIAEHLNSLYLLADPLYVQDFKDYAKENQSQNLPKAKEKLHKMPSAKSLFISCMWQWQKSDPTHIDLATVSIDDIISMESPVQMVMKCVEAGYLKRVKDYASYTHPIRHT